MQFPFPTNTKKQQKQLKLNSMFLTSYSIFGRATKMRESPDYFFRNFFSDIPVDKLFNLNSVQLIHIHLKIKLLDKWY